jgi:hypothetical protein
MSSKGPESWVSDTNVHSLRVEESPERILLLPYDQFVYAEFHPSGSEQRLDLMFATHEVQIHGYALRRLVIALQRRELALITPLSSSARPAISDGQTVIRQISVSEVKNPEAATPGHATTQPKSSKEP